MGRDVGTPPQTLTRHTSASSLAALTLRGLARRRGPAFAAGVDGRISRLFCFRGVSRQRCTLVLPSVFSFDLDRSDRQLVLAISVFDSLYC